MSKLTKAQLAKLEGLGDDGKMKVGDFLSWWLDPKNGKVGISYTDKPSNSITNVTAKLSSRL